MWSWTLVCGVAPLLAEGILMDQSCSGPGPALGQEVGLELGCSAGHGTLSPAWGPLTQSSGAVKC